MPYSEQNRTTNNNAKQEATRHGADSPTTHYEVLQVPADADSGIIRRAFQTLARCFHPDVNPGQQSQEQMMTINTAYTVLRDPAARSQYDADLTLQQTQTPRQTTARRNDRKNTMDTNTKTNYTETSRATTYSESASQGGEIIRIGIPVTPPSFQQLGIFVLDGSGSMTEGIDGGLTKAQAVNGAVRELFTRFKASRQRANFSFAVVAFDDGADVVLDITPADAVDDNADYDPLAGHGGGTLIGGGLTKAKEIATRFLTGARPDIPASVVVVVMSDGQCGNPQATVGVAQSLKGIDRVTLCATHFAQVGQSDPAAQLTLKQIATDPVRGYKTVYDAESLRAFFLASVSAGKAI